MKALLILVPLSPKSSEIKIKGVDAEVKWDVPQMFGEACQYKLMAMPNSTGGRIKSARVNRHNRNVNFVNLSPALEYDFRLETTCNGSKPVTTSLGIRKTGPGGKIILINHISSRRCFIILII